MNVTSLLRRRAPWLAVALVVAAVGGLVLTATRSGLALSLDPRGTGCRGFWGETVEATAWSGGGRFLAVASSGDNGLSKTRVFEWPGMRLVTTAATDLASDYAAIDEAGTVYWISEDPLAEVDSTTLWRQTAGGGPESLGPLAGGPYLSLTLADGALVATEVRPDPEASRLVRLAVTDPAASPVQLTEWMVQAGDAWVDRSGDWLVWIEPNVPSDDPQQVVVRHGDRDARVTLPGYGGRVPTLTPAHDAVVYQRSETARLTVMDVTTGELRGELDEREFFGGEVSSQGILAAPTAHGPWQTNELCVLDVGARLATLADGTATRSSLPALPAADDADQAALLAAVRHGGTVDLGSLLAGDWSMGYTFHSYDDNTTALNALGVPFDLESAAATLGDGDGTVVVLADARGDVLRWFAIPGSALKAPFPRPDFFPNDARFRVIAGDPPALVPD